LGAPAAGKGLTDTGLALPGVQNPGAVLPGRLMALVLSMPARQLGDPVAVFILMPSE